MVGPVYPGRLDHTRRHLHEGLPQKEDAEYADASGDDQSCVCVQKSPVCQDDVAGNVGGCRGQHVGSHDHREEDLLSLKFHKHDGVGDHGPGHNLDEQGKRRHVQAVRHVFQKRRIENDLVKVLPLELGREEGRHVHDLSLCLQRAQDHPDKGKDGEHAEHKEYNHFSCFLNSCSYLHAFPPLVVNPFLGRRELHC